MNEKISFFEGGVAAGFPSAADDYRQQPLDLHALLIKHPEATFFVRVMGDSMVGAGIHTGDILIVDRAIKAAHGKIIVALVNGEFTVKRLQIKENQLFLAPENPQYGLIEVPEGADFEVWGVVTYVIHCPR